MTDAIRTGLTPYVVAGVLAAFLLAPRPAKAFEAPSGKDVAKAVAVYGTLYTMAIITSRTAAFVIGAMAAPSYTTLAVAFGVPVVTVAVMSNGVPWAVEAIPPWVDENYDQWMADSELTLP